jgi:hypothetical protein
MVVSSLPPAIAPARLAEQREDDLALPPDAKVPAGQGLLDMESDERATWFVDGADVGHGTAARVVLSPGSHEVRERTAGEVRSRTVIVRAGRLVRLSLLSSSSRPTP